MKNNNSGSFIIMMAAWLFMNLIYAFVTAIQSGKTNESGVILFWSGLYILLSWAVFILIPQTIFKKLKFGKFILFAAPIMGTYAAMVYSLLLGKMFGFNETYFFFLTYAILTGLIYGFLLSLISLKQSAKKALMYLVPVVGIFFYILFPLILPSQAYRFMPDSTQDKIVSRLIPTLKVGDPYQLFLD